MGYQSVWVARASAKTVLYLLTCNAPSLHLLWHRPGWHRMAEVYHGHYLPLPTNNFNSRTMFVGILMDFGLSSSAALIAPVLHNLYLHQILCKKVWVIVYERVMGYKQGTRSVGRPGLKCMNYERVWVIKGMRYERLDCIFVCAYYNRGVENITLSSSSDILVHRRCTQEERLLKLSPNTTLLSASYGDSIL